MVNGVREDISAFCELHPNFKAVYRSDNVFLEGLYHFLGTYKGEFFEDFFHLTLVLPFQENKYTSLPKVYENRRINGNFHHINSSDNSLCLATSTDLRLVFEKDPTVENLLKRYIDPYLLGFLYYELHNEMPFGERSHGKRGIIEFYAEIFNISKPEKVVPFLRYINENQVFRGHADCPCGSGNIIRKCHLSEMKWAFLPENDLLRSRIKKDLEVIK